MTPRRPLPPRRRFRAFLLLSASLGGGGAATAAVDAEFRVLTPDPVFIGDSVQVGLFLVSDAPGPPAPVAAVELVFAWDADALDFVSLDATGGPTLSFEGFVVAGSGGLNESNPPMDGDGLYIALSQLGSPVLANPAPGTLLTTFVFEAIQARESAEIVLLPSGGEPPRASIVFDGVTPNTDVTGELRSTSVRILSPCGPADITSESACTPGQPDGLITLSDFSCYLSEWSLQSSFADITATGTCAFGTGGDGVDLSDFSCYLSLWSLGCP